MNNRDIFDIVNKMRAVFENESFDFTDTNKKNAFISEVNSYFSLLYGTFKNAPDGQQKNDILEYIREMQDNINGSFTDLNEKSFGEAKDFVTRLNDYLTRTLGNVSANADAKKSYQDRLENYKNALKIHKQYEKDYKSRNITYGAYAGNYGALYNFYNDLVREYKALGDLSLEKPPVLKMIPKSVDDLMLKDMHQEQEDYERLFDFYEGDIYPEYEDVARGYDDGKVSTPDYLIEASKCLTHSVILDSEYEKLQKQFREYEEMFGIEGGEYKIATEEELNLFYVDLAEYNSSIEEYRKQLLVFEEVKSKYESGLLFESEYMEQLKIVTDMEANLEKRQKDLKKRKTGIYNNTVLSILQKRKDIIESHLRSNSNSNPNNPNLSDDEVKKLNANLDQIQKLINEIYKFRATIVIKSFKKSDKKVRNSGSGNGKSNGGSGSGGGKPKSQADYANIDKPTESFFFGDNGGNDDDFDYAKELDEYKKLLEAYNEQLYVFYEKEKKFISGEIPYDGEYEKEALYIVDLYKKMQTAYAKVYGYYEKEQQKIMQDKELTDDEKTKKGMELEAPKKPDQPYISMEKEEPPVEVVKTTVWQWIKDHKKQILIALGLTALAISIIVLVTQLLPAIMAAMKATQAAGLLSQMVTNAGAWHTAIASEKIALHGANTALASQITALTGMSNVFNTATGVWTIGGNTLANAAAQSALVAGKASSLVSALQGVTLGTGIGGLGLLGTGLLLKDRSVQYKVISYKIRSLKNVSNENIVIEAENISNEIKKSEISAEEKNILNKKLKFRLNALQRKLKKLKKNIPDNMENNEDNTPDFSR